MIYRKKFLLVIIFLILFIATGCSGKNSESDHEENQESNSIQVENIKAGNIVNNSDKSRKEITVEEAIEIVKKSCKCDDSNKMFIYENTDEEGNYIIAIRNKEDTTIIDWYYVNPKTGEFTTDMGIYN